MLGAAIEGRAGRLRRRKGVADGLVLGEAAAVEPGLEVARGVGIP